MAALAAVSDLFLLMGKPTPADDSLPFKRAELILTLASDWAREFARKTWNDPLLVPVTIRGLVLAGARREYVNPKRVSYEVKGPESASYQAAAYPPGFFTDDEIAHLRKYHGGTGGLWTQSTYRDESYETDGYLAILPQGGWMAVYSPFDPGAEDAYHL